MQDQAVQRVESAVKSDYYIESPKVILKISASMAEPP
jgi:hypothetical protein